MIDPEYVTSSEAAEILWFTVQHVRRLAREGKLDGVKLGRDWVIARESVARFAGRRDNLDLPLRPTPLALQDSLFERLRDFLS